MIKYLLGCCVGLIIGEASFAAIADSTATITLSRENYEFVYNTRANRVEVKSTHTDNYITNGSAVRVPIVEAYNDEVTIDDVSCKVDNHTPMGFKPEYSYYSVGDIFYSDSRVCFFEMGLQRTSKGNVNFAETVMDPRYFTSVFFPEEFKIGEKQLTFKIPHWMKVELKEYNFAGFDIKKTVKTDGDNDIITYTAHNLPGMDKEENGPGPTYIYPHILVLCKSAVVKDHNFTYFATLDDQYAWYHELVKSINQDNAVIAAKAKDITAGLTNDMDKIKAIFYYVQDNIRYIAFENGIAGFKPEKADEVLRKKYGDCKGMANLTKSLLVSLGYDARLCWLGTNHIAYDYQTPSIAVDNHMICGLVYKGKTIYLDATETYLGINEYAERIQGRQILMENGNKYVLARVPLAATNQNSDQETSKLSIDGNALTGSVSHVWKGEEKEVVLSGLNSIKKERTDEAINRFLSNDNNDYQISNLAISTTDNPDKDLTASYKLNFKNAVSSFNKSYYVDLDPRKEFLNSAIKIDERKHDYWFEYKTNINKEAELTIPANYKVDNLPPALNIVNPDYEFHVQYFVQPGKLIYKKSIQIKNTRLVASKFAQWNKDIEQLAKTYNDNVTLKPITQ